MCGTIGIVGVQISRGESRFVEREAGRLTRHGFSFGPVYDPERLSFGPMVCHDDHVLGAGQGFDDHPHSALEIITWVVSGRVSHRDSLGNDVVLAAGECGLLTAGSGVRHSEHAVDGPARFVQVWLSADPEATPAYHHLRGDDLAPSPWARGERLVGEPGGVSIPGASYDVVRLDAHETVTLPAAGRVHAFLASGALLRSSLAEPLQAGDAFCLTDEPAHPVTAAVATELLVWSFD